MGRAVWTAKGIFEEGCVLWRKHLCLAVHIKHYVALEFILFSADESLCEILKDDGGDLEYEGKRRNKRGKLKWYRFEQSQHCEFAGFFCLFLLRLFSGDALLIRVLKTLRLRLPPLKHALGLAIQLPQLEESSVGSGGETGCFKLRLSVLLLAN